MFWPVGSKLKQRIGCMRLRTKNGLKTTSYRNCQFYGYRASTSHPWCVPRRDWALRSNNPQFYKFHTRMWSCIRPGSLWSMYHTPSCFLIRASGAWGAYLVSWLSQNSIETLLVSTVIRLELAMKIEWLKWLFSDSPNYCPIYILSFTTAVSLCKEPILQLRSVKTASRV